MDKKALKNNKVYTYDEWRIVEKEINRESKFLEEVVFSLGNGYIFMNGSFEEGDYGEKSTYIKGIYDIQGDAFQENIYTSLEKKHEPFNVINGKNIKIYIGAEEFNLLNGTIFEYKRFIDMKEGVLHRHLIWESPKGKRIEVNTKRMVSFDNAHLASISYNITPLNFSGEIKIISSMEGNIEEAAEKKLQDMDCEKKKKLNILEKDIKGDFGGLISETVNTKFILACGMENQLLYEGEFEIEAVEYDEKLEIKYTIDSKVNKEIEFNKYISYFTSKDCSKEKLLVKARGLVEKSKKIGLSKIEWEQKRFLQEFWRRIEEDIKDNPLFQAEIRFNEFNLLKANGKSYTILK